jgi:hypothetical protein
MRQQAFSEAKLRSTEPEIIPPGVERQRVSRIWVFTSRRYPTHLWITPMGPIGTALLVLLIGILALAGSALLLGAALVGVAAAGVLMIGGIVSKVLSRRLWR